MNSRRKINNIIRKEGYSDMFEIIYTHNKDMRSNNFCLTITETCKYNNGQIKFYDKTRLQKMSRILNTSQKELITLIIKEINKL